RRHTRSYGDWSSDVCSSDLAGAAGAPSRRPVGSDGRAGDPHVLKRRRKRRLRLPEAVEARAVRGEGSEEVLERTRLVEVARVERLVARVAAQLLDDLARLVVRGIEVAGSL